MPLEHSFEPFTDPATLDLIFTMQDQLVARNVTVVVEPDALEKLGAGQNPIEVFKSHRATLEGVASTKFDEIGGGREVTILAADLH